MRTLLQDLSYGTRMLLRSPLLTLSAILALALGIGANTAIFSVVNAVLLRPLPYGDPGRLEQVYINRETVKNDHSSLSVADFLALRQGMTGLARVAAYFTPRGGLALTGGGEPEQVRGTQTSAELFDVLGLKPALGRPFLPEDEDPAAEPVVVLSRALWQRRFGADEKILGQPISLNGRSHTVVGIAPAGFSFPPGEVSDLWALMRNEPPRVRRPFFLQAIARPQTGVSHERLRAVLQAVAAQAKRQYTDSPADWTFDAAPLKEFLVGGVRPVLLILLGAVSLVLLIATVNIANLLLARATSRRKEMAIRAALGAGRMRLARQLITESLLLAGLGGLLGVILSLWGIDLLVALGPRGLPRLQEVRVDLGVLLYTVLVSLLSGVLFGLAPALQAARPGVAQFLQEGGRGVTDRAGRRLRNLLVVGEFALAVMLLGGAGLLINSFLRLQRVSPGFDSANILTARLSLPEGRYGGEAARAAFFRRLLERIGRLPGVEAAGIGMALPPHLAVMTNPYTVEGRPVPPGRSAPTAGQLMVSPDFLRALGVPLLRGRFFNDADVEGAPLAIIINETMARQLYPGEDPIGRRLQLGDPDPAGVWDIIVGVVGDVKYSGLEAAPEPTMYTPYYQDLWWPTMYLVLRSSLDPSGLEKSMRGEIDAIDPLLPLAEVRTIPELVSESVAAPRFRTTLVGVFAGVALLLAAVGIYGILSYAVSLRTQEMGIRMALGARRQDVLLLVLRQGMSLALAGVGLGILGGLALSRVLGGLLFGLSPTDPATYIVVASIMTAVAFLACYLPARRATRVDPMIALRSE